MIPEKNCSGCPLHRFRTKVVMPDGNKDSNVVFVGEAPGENEDLTGRPFVGLGRSACRSLTGYEGRMSDIVNREMKITACGKEVSFIPTYHPAACIYNRDSTAELRRTMGILKERYL